MALPISQSGSLISFLASNQKSELTPFQQKVDDSISRFSEGVGSPSGAPLFMMGGLLGQFSRLGLAQQILKYPQHSIFFKTSSSLLGVGVESSIVDLGGRTLQNLSGAHSNWSWQGPQGISQGILHQFLMIGAFKSLHGLTQQTPFAFQHTVMNLALVSSLQLERKMAHGDTPSGNISEDFLQAEISLLQMMAGFQLLHTLAPQLRAFEKGIALFTSNPISPSFKNFPPSFLQEAKALGFSGEIKKPFRVQNIFSVKDEDPSLTKGIYTEGSPITALTPEAMRIKIESAKTDWIPSKNAAELALTEALNIYVRWMNEWMSKSPWEVFQRDPNRIKTFEDLVNDAKTCLTHIEKDVRETDRLRFLARSDSYSEMSSDLEHLSKGMKDVLKTLELTHFSMTSRLIPLLEQERLPISDYLTAQQEILAIRKRHTQWFIPRLQPFPTPQLPPSSSSDDTNPK